MMYRYGFKWNARPKYREPVNEVAEQRARTLWDGGEHVSVSKVAASEGVVPEYTIVSSEQGTNVVVDHYNGPGSLILTVHSKSQGDSSSIFLTNVVSYLYPDDDAYYSVGGNVGSRQILFRPDGYAKVWTRVKEAPAESVDEYRDVDVSEFTVPALAWGDWDRLGYWEPGPLPGPG